LQKKAGTKSPRLETYLILPVRTRAGAATKYPRAAGRTTGNALAAAQATGISTL